MKARMRDNLIVRYQLCSEFKYNRDCGETNELLAVKKMHGWLEYIKTKEFLKSIEGKVVDLVFIGKDAFEKNDNNHWLPNELWEAV